MLTHLPLMFREKIHCSKCDYVTITPQKMTSHINRNCKEKEKVESVCFCGKVFSCKRALQTHGHTHKPRKGHKCTICDKVHSSPRGLKVWTY